MSSRANFLCLLWVCFLCLAEGSFTGHHVEDEHDEPAQGSLVLLQSSYFIQSQLSLLAEVASLKTVAHFEGTEKHAEDIAKKMPLNLTGASTAEKSLRCSPSVLHLLDASWIVGIVVFLCVLGMHAYRIGNQDNPDSIQAVAANGGKQYLAILDNAKLVLMMGIVLSHYTMLKWNAQVSAPSALMENWLWNFPLAGFSFVSGALSKGPPNRSKLQSLVMRMLLPFLLYTLVFDASIMQWLKHEPFRVSYLSQQIKSAAPFPTWYLQSLIVWKLLAWSSHVLASGWSIPIWASFTSISLALFVVSSFFTMHIWSLDNGIAYLPCFAVGFLFPIEELIMLVPMTPQMAVAGCFSIVAWTLGGQYCPIRERATKHLHEALLGSYGCVSALSWCEGMSSALIYVTVFMMLLVVSCPRQEYWFTKYGRDGAMYVYLLNLPALKLFMKALRGADPYQSNWKASPTSDSTEAIIVAFTLTVLLSSWPARWLFSPVIEPTKCLVRWRAKQSLAKGHM